MGGQELEEPGAVIANEAIQTKGLRLRLRLDCFVLLAMSGGQELPESGAVIASDSEAIQTKPRHQALSPDCFALLAMTARAMRV